jgi:Mor family transcriptional regulator
MLARNRKIMHQKRRDFIISELNNGIKVSEIAKKLNLCNVTIYREIKEIELELTHKDNEKEAKNIILKIQNRKNEAKNAK